MKNTATFLSACLLLAFVWAVALPASAQLTGTISIPNGTYPDLASVISSLNTQGVGGGGVTINLTVSQTAPAGGYRLGSAVLNASTSAGAPLRINGNGNTLTAPVGTSASLDGIFTISGTDYVTINGLNLQESAANTTPTTAMEWGYALLNRNTAAPFDGCQYDTIRNCTITLNRTVATGSNGILSAHYTASSSTTLSITAAGDLHSYNGFYANNISNVIRGINLVGFSAAPSTAMFDQSNDIGGSTAATGNILTNCIGALYTGIGAITASYQQNANISNNTVNNLANGGTPSVGAMWGIYAYGTGANFTIHNNNINLTEASFSSSYFVYGIYSNAALTSVTANNNTVVISENAGSFGVNNYGLFLPNGLNTSLSNNSVTQNMAVTTGATYGIYTTTTGALLIDSNTVKQVATVAGSSQLYSIVNGGNAVSETVTNNSFNNSSASATGNSGFAALIYTVNTTPVKNISNNAVTGSFTHTSSGDFYGILCNPGTAASGGSFTMAGNAFSNVAKGGSGGLYGIYHAPSVTNTQNISINNNTFSNLTGTGTGPVVAIYCASGATDSIYSNTIANCSSGGSLFGIYQTTPNPALSRIYKNKVYNLATTGTTTGGVFGITVAGGTATNVYNNYIGDLTAPALSSTADGIRGISLTSTVALSSINVYYNTIRLAASSTGANFSTAGIYHAASATATTAALDLRNNIIVNLSTPSGTGTAVAFRRSAAALGNLRASSNNNLYYAGTPGPANLIESDGTNSYQTLAAYQAAVAPVDAASITENPAFASVTGSAANYLHFNPGTATGAESGGTVIAGFNDDYDGNVRQGSVGYTGFGTAPDIGADEWDNCIPVTGITQPPASRAVCAGNNTNITAGASNATYKWQVNTGSSFTDVPNAAPYSGINTGTLTITGATAAMNGYQYRLVFLNNCGAATYSTATTLTVTTITSSVTAQTNVSCYGAATGSATVTPAGGTTPYTYAWSPSGGNGASAGSLAAGTYNVTITDNLGCQKVQQVDITQPAPIVTSVINQTNVSCYGGTNGSATVTASGGAGSAYTYSWSPSGGTAATATGLAANTYTVTVKDVNLCPVTQTVVITQPAALIANGTQINVFCNGGANGSATVAPTGGTPPYTYSWTGSSSTTATASSLSAGTYVVTITDAKLCQVTQSFTITQTASLAATSSQVNVSCFGGNNGSASIVITGGTSPYTYTWTGAASTTATAANLTAGNYSVTVRDFNNCQTSQSYTITQPPVLTASITAQTPVSCFGGSNATATVTPSGGTAPYSYSWSPGGSTAATAANLAAGTYTVTITDAKGCTVQQGVTIIQPAAELSVTTSSNTPQCAGGTLTINSAPAGGTSPYTYSWSGPGYTGSAPSVLLNAITTAMTGNYTVTVTDSRGCTAAAVAAVTVNTAPAAPGSILGTAVSCNGTATTYRVNALVPTATSYSWTLPAGWTGASAADTIRATPPNGSSSGTIRVTANNTCGSSAATTLAVTSTVMPAQPGAITGSAAVCGTTIQAYSIAALPEATTYTWTLPSGGWSVITGAGTTAISTLTGSAGGNITVTAANVCGTSAARTLPVTVTNTPAQPSVITGSNNVCGGTPQTYRISKTAEATTYTWTVSGNGWTRSAGTPADTFVNTVAGTAGIILSVSASNACGTSLARTLAIGVTNTPAQPGIITGRDSLCAGSGDLYSITGVPEATAYTWTIPTSGFTGSAGTGGLTYNLATAGTVPAGSYAISVQAANFCGTSPARTKTIIVNTPVTPTVMLSTTATTICAGQQLTFTAIGTDTGASPLYQWKINGVNSGAPTASRTFTPAALNNNDVVSVALRSSLPCPTLAAAESNPIRITVNPLVIPGVTISSNYPASVVCRGTPVVFRVSAVTGAGTAPAYQWVKNGINVGTGSVTYTDAGLNTGDSVRVIMTSSAVCPTQLATQSGKIVSTVYPVAIPTVNVVATPGTTIIPGQSVTFTAQVTNVGPNPQYQWLKNGIGISGGTSATYTSNTLRDGDEIRLQVGADLPCASPGVVTSVPQVIHIPSTAVGAATKGGADISLYPNPSDGRFTISVHDYPAGKRLDISLISAIGQVVYQVSASGSQADWKTIIELPEGVASGSYMLRFSDDRQMTLGIRKIDVIR